MAEHGAEAILPYSYSGTLGLVQMTVCNARLWNRLGASQLQRSICGAAAEFAVEATVGARWGVQCEDVVHSRLVILWGHNPVSTAPHFMPFLLEARRRGCFVVVIDPLHVRIDLTQPWDGEKNRALSNTPLAAYTTPYDGNEPSVNTPYRVFVGGGALFNEDGKPVRFPADVPDGTSNTIMVIHATEQVPWAEPRELVYDPNLPLPKLGHPAQSGAFQVLMADGSVRFITDAIDERVFRALVTYKGGEKIENLDAVAPVQKLDVTIAGADREYLLFDWLKELLYHFDAEHLLLSRFEVRIDDQGLRASVWGEPLDRARHELAHEVKAITYHGLRVEPAADGWLAEVIVDI